MDNCTHCTLKGKLYECLSVKCSQHESWMVIELKRAMESLAKRCDDELVFPEDIDELLNVKTILKINGNRPCK